MSLKLKYLVPMLLVIVVIGLESYLLIYQSSNEISQNITKKVPVNITDFVTMANFPKVQQPVIEIEHPERKFTVYTVRYGELQCPTDTGCWYSYAIGMNYRDKNGWLYLRNYGGANVLELEMYDFDASDTFLFSDEFFQFLLSQDSSLYQNQFLPLLAKDKDTPRSALFNIANALYIYVNPEMAETLVRHPNTQDDEKILTLIANLPPGGPTQVYMKVKEEANTLLKGNSSPL